MSKIKQNKTEGRPPVRNMSLHTTMFLSMNGIRARRPLGTHVSESQTEGQRVRDVMVKARPTPS